MSQSSHTPSPAKNAGQSCRECRRRHGKCDFKLPVCSVCQRYNRHCLYDKHSRSALTRKHLTEVEERLERAEALLRVVFTESELAKILVEGVSTEQVAQSLLGANAAAARLPHRVGQRQDSHISASESRGDDVVQPSTEQQRDEQLATNHSTFRTDENASTVDDSVPSAADDDFEWDERDPLWTSYDAVTGQQSEYGTNEAAINKITDGMATLTANNSNTGFLGPVSGATLLRLISEHRSNDQTLNELSELDEGQSSISAGSPTMRSAESSFSTRPWIRAQPIMTRAYVDALVDLYFAFYHPTFPILHEATFRQHYQALSGRPGDVWQTLAHLVAALGSFVSTDATDETDINLFNTVKSQLTIESLESGSLVLVQAFAMAANYLQKRNRPNSGYNYGGVALRLAISLGLHKEFQNWHTVPLKKEIRRRVWWSLCVLDVGATITYGRPLNWPQAGVEAQFPLNINEKDLDITSVSLPPEQDCATTYSYVRTQSAYHLATIPIYNRLISNPLPSATEMTAMDDDFIESWRRQLPHFMNDNDLQLSGEFLLGHSIGRWRFRIMRIIMYRPFFLRWVQDGFKPLQLSFPEDIATDRCLAAAEECIAIISRFWDIATHTRLAAWYVLYFLLQAVLIPVHCLRRQPSHPHVAKWVAQVRTALVIMSTMVDTNSSAVKCRDIIYRLCGSSLVGHGSPQPEIGTFTSDLSALNSSDPSDNPWLAEIDAAIDDYNIYCDRVMNAATQVVATTADTEEADFENKNIDPYSLPNLGIDVGSGGRNWDLGWMLIQ